MVYLQAESTFHMSRLKQIESNLELTAALRWSYRYRLIQEEPKEVKTAHMLNSTFKTNVVPLTHWTRMNSCLSSLRDHLLTL